MSLQVTVPDIVDYFRYQNNRLHCEEVAVDTIAQAHGTPLYIYSQRTFLDHYDRIQAAFDSLSPTICYSVKCCHNLQILKMLREHGAGFDVVSGGELQRVTEVGADPSRIVFAGVGKTDDEIAAALQANVAWFNVESEQELLRIRHLAATLDRQANIALRVNPDVDARTHEYTTTGLKQNKFGIDFATARRLFTEHRNAPNLRMTGIHVHIGSPVNTTEPYVQAVTRAVAFIAQLRADGSPIDTLNIGGGFGAHYEGSEAPPAVDYARAILPILQHKDLHLILEPGRSIAGNAGILVGRVIYTKQGADRRFIITDAAMTELLRPALYGAYHFAWPVNPPPGMVPPTRRHDLQLPGTTLTDIVGPVCESGDFLAKDRYLPPIESGQLIAVFTAGAYGAVMANRYNSRPQAPEILVNATTHHLIRRRETYHDLIQPERI